MKVGILGGGQLARMLSLAAHPLEIKTRCLVTELTPTIAGISECELWPNPQDVSTLEKFATSVDVVTYETENVPREWLEILASRVALKPNPEALFVAQDRLLEKQAFQRLGIPTARFHAINSQEDLAVATENLGFPCVLKTRRWGYDGKGQYVLESTDDIEAAWQALGPQPLILEAFVAFQAEVSLIAVRGDQSISFYPITENIHRGGILRCSLSSHPYDYLQAQAEDFLQRLLEDLNYLGVLVVEFFVMEGNLIANEMAPRVHNSGHWTIEGAMTSQFENHLRAICGLPLGSTALRGISAMFNAIGELPAREAILQLPHAHFHSYEKQPRPGRKVGHVTLNAHDLFSFEMELQELKALFALS